MARPFTDIQAAISGNPVKNGTLITSTTFTGEYSKSDTYVREYPTIATIDDKYGYKFYNGIFVELTGDQTVLGG
jgi:hypothetical protein